VQSSNDTSNSATLHKEEQHAERGEGAIPLDATNRRQWEELVMGLVERARLTVDDLIVRRHKLRTYDEKVRHALDLVQMHFEEENPDRIEECIRLYTDDAAWEAPARAVSYTGPEQIKKMYLKLFSAVEDFVWTPLERWGTPDRVFDDSIATFRLVGDGFENCPMPIGTKVKMRLIHNFHVRDGLISKEIGYEVWRRADA
jgi:hypothetical protein